jgi:hypothetical protein
MVYFHLYYTKVRGKDILILGSHPSTNIVAFHKTILELIGVTKEFPGFTLDHLDLRIEKRRF